MRAPRRRIRRMTPKRHSLAEQDRIIARFEEARSRDVRPNEAIAGLGASLASVYRWQRARNPSKGMPAATFAQELSIDTAIARLCDERNDDRQTFLDALFKFIAWLRWPTTPGDHPAAMMVCAVSYLSAGRSARTLDELPPDDLALALRHVSIDTLKRVCSDDLFAMPSFELWKLDDQPYTKLDYLAQVTHFLLAYRPPSNNPRDAASLFKAYAAMEGGLFKYKWHISRRTFSAFWRESAASAPFQYVERLHPSLEFSIDPSKDDFAENIDEAYSRRGELRLHLARCRAATQLLQSKLDQRSLEPIRFPRFPSTLSAEVIEPPELPEITDVIRAEFRKWRN